MYARNLLSMLILVVIVAPTPQLAAQESPAERYAVVTHKNVRVRAGTADYHAVLRQVDPGLVVRLIGFEGDWARVRLPGGVIGYAKKAQNGRPYIDLKAPGEGLVIVDDLQLRPQPNTDWPAMGELNANDVVTVLSEEADGWYRILAPDDHDVFIHRDYLRVEADTETWKATFAERDAAERRAILEQSPESAKALERRAERQNLHERLAAAQKRMEEVLAGKPNAAELAEVREELEAIAEAAGEGTPLQTEARFRASHVATRERMASRLDTAEERIENLEKNLERSQARYVEDLERFREEKGIDRPAPAASTPPAGERSTSAPARFLRYGIGRIHKDYLSTATSGLPVFVLRKGAENRYLLVSRRYDLSEYHDKEIGITGWKFQDPLAGAELRKVLVTRIEILD